MKLPFPRHPRTIPAFTLVELLVVIAVIAVLAAILVGVTGNVRQSASAIKCVSNLRQIGIQFRTYANNNDGNLPSMFYWDTNLIDALDARDSTKIWRCDLDKIVRKAGKKWNTDPTFVAPARSYIANAFSFNFLGVHPAYPGQQVNGSLKVLNVDNPSKMWLLTELHGRVGDRDFVFGEHGGSLMGGAPFPFPHQGSVNILMLDGRVVTIKESENDFFRDNARGNVPWR